MSGDGLRLDKWLWHARFYKSRTLAAAVCCSGRIRVNSAPIPKSHRQVKPGDVLTFPHGRHIRIIRVLALGSRRGPASEARLLYQDLAPIGGPEPTPGPLAQLSEPACDEAERTAPQSTSSEAPRTS